VPDAGSQFPLDTRYASGVSLVEIETITAGGLSLTESFFKSAEFQACMAEAHRALQGAERGHPPGVIGRRELLRERARASCARALAALAQLAHAASARS
jgi:hypothetical protein